jgi:hypothetical protein
MECRVGTGATQADALVRSEAGSVCAGSVCAEALRSQLSAYLAPVQEQLDGVLDARLVRTFGRAVEAIVSVRHGQQGLLLSELGGCITNGAHAPAGTKRLGNLIRSERWSSEAIEAFLAAQGTARVHALVQAHETPLVLWDESVLEKPGSRQLEGLCPVRSSEAAWKSRLKPGYYRPPAAPVFVPGMQWVSLLVAGMSGAPTLYSMRWWSTRGAQASDRQQILATLVPQCATVWGRQVLHVFDRGFANGPWLQTLASHELRFLVRWRTNYKLLDAQGVERKPYEITRGKRTLAHYTLIHSDGTHQQIGVYFCPVRHPQLPHLPLWLVVSRQGKGRNPWYLLTTEPVRHPDQAWRLIRGYARRWQIEMSFRYQKSELALESPRLHAWRHRLKLLLLASLAYAFLLTLLQPAYARLRHALLEAYCHRTGKRCRNTPAPLYRLRQALSQLWLSYPRPFIPRNSG